MRGRAWAWLAVGALVSTVVPATVSAQTLPPGPAGLDGGLAEVAGPEATIVTNPDDGDVEFVGLPAGDDLDVDAQEFVDEFGAELGEPDPGRDFEVVDENETGAGGTSTTFQQEQQGVPVLAAQVRVQTDAGGEVVSAGGETTDGGTLDVSPAIDAAAAEATAIAGSAEAHGIEPASLEANPAEPWIYDPALLDEPGHRRLVWRTEVTAGETGMIRDLVLVDADEGSVALRLDEVMEEAGSPNRRVCDNANVHGASLDCAASLTPARTEGQDPHAVAEVNAAYDNTGSTYDYYYDNFGRDSIDGAGMPLTSIVRVCLSQCPYANASWTGSQMLFGAGYASADDVVTHELTHGVTEHESGLLYMNQSGAINESLSDIFGEYDDLTNGIGTDTPAVRWLVAEDRPSYPVRNMADPPQNPWQNPDHMGHHYYETWASDNGGVHNNSGVGNKAAYLIADGDTFNGFTIPGIGIAKAQRIWYEVATNFLTPGSDYADLGVALIQACANLLGVVGINPVDCQSVNLAVIATEMVQGPAPANDDFADAIALTGSSGTTRSHSTSGSKETGEPSILAGSDPGTEGGRSVWWSWTAPASGPTRIDTIGSTFDTMLGVFTGNEVDGLTRIADNDNILPPYVLSRVAFQAVAGTTYRIAVDGADGSWGSYASYGLVNLTWSGVARPTATITAPADDAVYARNQAVTADFTCASETGIAPTDGCIGTVADGDPLDTTTLGDHEITVTATDTIGNTTERTHTYTVHDARPDARIRLGVAGALRGNNVYNTTGLNQTRSTTVNARRSAIYYVSVQNDAPFPDALRIRGQASTRNFAVRYFGPANANITTAVTTTGFPTPSLEPAATYQIKVVVTAAGSAPRGATVTRRITTTSTTHTTIRDVVSAATTRR